MTIQTVNLSEKQGSTWEYLITVKDDQNVAVDLTGYTFRGAVAKATGGTPLATFDFTILDQVAGKGQVLATLPESKTKLLPCKTSKAPDFTTTDFLYDIEIVFPSGKAYCFIQGKITVTPEVSTNGV